MAHSVFRNLGFTIVKVVKLLFAQNDTYDARFEPPAMTLARDHLLHGMGRLKNNVCNRHASGALLTNTFSTSYKTTIGSCVNI